MRYPVFHMAESNRICCSLHSLDSIGYCHTASYSLQHHGIIVVITEGQHFR